FKAYGWHVEKVDGNDLKGVADAIRNAKKEKNRPSLIIARTHIAFGSPNKQDTAGAHGAPLGEEEIKLAKRAVGWPERKRFYIPDKALKEMRKAVSKGRTYEKKWNDMIKRYRKKYPALYEKLLEFSEGRLPEGWDKDLPVFTPDDGSIATRSASGKVLNVLAHRVENLIGGSADLAPSNNTYLKGYPDFGEKKRGRNLHFGVREHAMGAALNGMALTGMVIPYGGTFLVFSDYMRPAIRLASLMKQHVIYVFTHDSIGLGEDGPTHQPVEHLAGLRAIPDFIEIRPADANEAREAWKVALNHKDGPVGLILSRQKLPVIDRRRYASPSGISRGAYVIADSGKTPQIILIASGSEVHIALSAYEELLKKAIDARVVNMASFALFENQSERYKNSVLPPDIRNRIAIEAGVSLPWYKYVGLEGKIIGVDRFGASAPYKTIFEKYGLTVERVIKESLKMIR
ncbi:MAG: transketolase, partial [Nitrospirae bacterium]